MKPYLGAAITTPDENYKKISFDDLSDESFKVVKEGGWVAMVQHYFISAWIPEAQDQNSYHLRQLGSQDMYLLGFTGPRTEVAPGTQGSIKARFYAGDRKSTRLNSSHVKISYAVFCLKKKKNTQKT